MELDFLSHNLKDLAWKLIIGYNHKPVIQVLKTSLFLSVAHSVPQVYFYWLLTSEYLHFCMLAEARHLPVNNLFSL